MIPFNKPHLTGYEIDNIKKAYDLGQLSGDGWFTNYCSSWLENKIGCSRALLTHSCTAALEMSALLANIQPGDEVIMPSYTFVSTANAFVLQGAIPVFVDIRSDTLNLNENLIESAITAKTKVIVPVHYAGISCEMDKIIEVASKNKLIIVEDAAQSILSKYKDKYLGTLGDLGCLSFHETKNIISGEGGALIINNSSYIDRAEVIRQKGTNRTKFISGQVDKYSWVDKGSSYLPGEIIAAFLSSQLNEAEAITSKRLLIWQKYHESFEELEFLGVLRRPITPSYAQQNAHMYYLLLNNKFERDSFIERMKSQGINCVFHYVPLHSSPMGTKYGRASGNLPVTTNLADRLVRLPLWIDLSKEELGKIISTVYSLYK